MNTTVAIAEKVNRGSTWYHIAGWEVACCHHRPGSRRWSVYAPPSATEPVVFSTGIAAIAFIETEAIALASRVATD